MNRYTVEHWRDGEKIASFDLNTKNITRKDGVARVAFPPGTITLNTGDELRFDPQGLVDLLQSLQSR